MVDTDLRLVKMVAESFTKEVLFMRKDEVLTGAEMFEYFAKGALSDGDILNMKMYLQTAGQTACDIEQSLRFAGCLTGMHVEVMPDPEGELQILFSTEAAKNAMGADCLIDKNCQYMIYVSGFSRSIESMTFNQLLYGAVIGADTMMLTIAAALVRWQLLDNNMARPFDEGECLKISDPDLREALKNLESEFKENRIDMAKISSTSIARDFDITAIRRAALKKLEWGMTPNELIGLIRMNSISMCVLPAIQAR